MTDIEPESEVAPPRVDLIDRRFVRWTLFFVVPLAVFLLVSAGIVVTGLGIKYTIMVVAQPQLEAGAPGVMRITLIDDQTGFFLPTRVRARLVTRDRVVPLFDGEVVDLGDAVVRHFQVPKLTPQRARLEVEVFFKDRSALVKRAVTIVARAPNEELVLPSDTSLATSYETVVHNDTQVAVVPEGRGLPVGLNSLLFVRVADGAGAPVSRNFSLRLPGKGRNSRVVSGKSDQNGLGALLVKPQDLHFPISVDGMGELHPHVVYSGLSIKVAAPLVAPGKPIVVDLFSISVGTPLYIDFYSRGRWVHSATVITDGRGRAHLEVLLPVSGRVRIEATHSVLQVGRQVAVRTVYIKGTSQGDCEAIGALLNGAANQVDQFFLGGVKGRCATLGRKERALLSAFLLAKTYQGVARRTPLINSRAGDDERLKAFKYTFRVGLMVAIIAIGVAVSLVIGLVAVRARQRQKRLLLMIMAEEQAGDEDGTVEVETVRTAHRTGTAFLVVSLFLVVLGAFVSIALLVMSLSYSSLPTW